MRYPNVAKMKFGSHLYGLDTPQSDVDYKGIYIPTLKEILLCDYPKTIKQSTGGHYEKNKPGDIDDEVMALSRFVDLAVKGETMAIDMLHCQNPIITSPIWEELVENRKRFYTRNMSAYVGYCKRQAAKYGTKGTRLGMLKQAIEVLSKKTLKTEYPILTCWDELPTEPELAEKDELDLKSPHTCYYTIFGKKYAANVTIWYLLDRLEKQYEKYGERARQAERNEGVDFKALSHAFRASFQLYYIYTNGDFEYPLPENEYILAVKQGKIHAKQVLHDLEVVVGKVMSLAVQSNLPEKVDKDYWDNWLVDVYQREFCIEA